MSDPRIAVLSGHSFGLTASLIAALGAGGMMVNLQDDDIHRRPDLMDRLDVLSMVLGHGDDRPQDSMGFRHPHPPARRAIAFVDTPKPLSKRRARRLRAKALATTPARNTSQIGEG